jgi:hypothetical protein
MKIKLAVIIFGLLFGLSHSTSVNAQGGIGLKASVGKYRFSASGIASPYASIVMTSQNIFLSSAVADSKGRFVLPRALVNDGFSDYCLEVSDIRRIGDSYTCFKTDPPESDYSKSDIFLAPTVGLTGRKITPNSSIFASGYTMPNSDVSVNLGNNLRITTEADVNGYYKVEINKIPKGSYELYAAATYQHKGSIKPTRTFKIESLGLLSSIPSWLLLLALILVLILIIIPLIILWMRRRRKRGRAGRSIHLPKLFFWRA